MIKGTAKISQEISNAEGLPGIEGRRITGREISKSRVSANVQLF